MRILLAGVGLAWISAAPASAQAINPEFVFGRDYTFERMEATRAVDDAQDKGTIRLVTYVYRPVKNDRHEVAVFSHGSTGGLATLAQGAGWEQCPAAGRRAVPGHARVHRGRADEAGTRRVHRDLRRRMWTTQADALLKTVETTKR